MSKQRYINTKIWEDGWFSSLDQIEQLVFIYLLTNAMTNIAGVYELSKATISRSVGLDILTLDEIFRRFEKSKKVYYVEGWVVLPNFIKNQNYNSPTIKKGIELELECIPEQIRKLINIPYVYGIHTLPHLIKSNLIKSNIVPPTKKEEEVKEYSFEVEIKKLEDNPRRDMNIIGLYFDYRKPDLKNYQQYQLALTRHLKPAKALVPFTDEQILKAIDYAKKEYKDIYTLETLLKILTK